MQGALLAAPGSKAFDLDAVADRDDPILMPGEGPVRLRGLVEEDARTGRVWLPSTDAATAPTAPDACRTADKPGTSNRRRPAEPSICVDSKASSACRAGSLTMPIMR